jgi:hypothetical protein
MATRSETKALAPAEKGVLRDLAEYPSIRDEIVGLASIASRFLLPWSAYVLKSEHARNLACHANGTGWVRE